MSESLPASDPGTQKRRSTRIVQAVPITVSGTDALGQPFKERTTTVMVNCHGCKYQSKHYVPKNSIVTLDIPRMEPGLPPRIVPGHVVWVQRGRGRFASCSKSGWNLKLRQTYGESPSLPRIGFPVLPTSRRRQFRRRLKRSRRLLKQSSQTLRRPLC